MRIVCERVAEIYLYSQPMTLQLTRYASQLFNIKLLPTAELQPILLSSKIGCFFIDQCMNSKGHRMPE
jgi:hypothetical protein